MKKIKGNTPVKGPGNSKWLKVIALVSFIFALYSCSGQIKNKKEPLWYGEQINSSISTDTVSKPQVQVKVNRKYDKNGNLVSFDSTYSFVYQAYSGDHSLSYSDSIMGGFKSYFDTRLPGLFDNQKTKASDNDSLFMHGFSGGYFQQRTELAQNLFNDLFKQLDSLMGAGDLWENQARENRKVH